MLTLREYQRKILETALRKNTLIILPTGTGKTIIAFNVIKNRIEKFPDKKIFFLAPTKPLVQQHYSSFIKIFQEYKDKTVSISGDIKPEKRELLYKTAQIFFITPQTLNNDIIDGRITFYNTSTVIVDEAHRAVKKYPYVFIIKKAVEQSKDLRIIGLTASPGFNIDRIKEVINNLYIEAIEIRTGIERDIRPYIKSIEIKRIDIDLKGDLLLIKELLDKTFNIRRDKLRELLNIDIKKGKKEILELQERLRKELDKNPGDYKIINGLSLLAEITKIEHARELIETQSVSTFLEYIDNLKNRLDISKSNALINFLNDVRVKKAIDIAKKLQKNGMEHPKLDVLKKIVLDNRDKKILIFAQIRKTVDVIYKELDTIGIKSAKFMGKSEMKQQEQIKILNEFKMGKFNVLISTSVGEEGIDIPKVDIVIFYEPVPSEIRYIQRRGRTGRTDVGTVYVLVTKKTRDEIFYWVAINKERKMLRFIKRLKHILELLNNNINVTINESSGRYISNMSDTVNNNSTTNILKYLRDKGLKKESDVSKTVAQSIGKKSVPIIIADYRERDTSLVQHLISLGVIVKLSNLEVGDYIVGKYIIERKTFSDFIKSLSDGRLESQLEKLKNKNAILVIEGENLDIPFNNKQNLVRSTILKILLDYKIPIIFTKDYSDTANYLYLLAKNSEKINNIRMDKKEVDPIKIKVNILKQIPGIGDKSAKELIKKYGSIEKILKTNKVELSRILGEKKAEKLKKIFSE